MKKEKSRSEKEREREIWRKKKTEESRDTARSDVLLPDR